MEHESLNSKKTQEIYKLIYSLKSDGQIKTGYNETVKAIKNNTAILVVIAKDAEPTCLIDPLPTFCEHRGIQYVFIDSKTALGKACGVDVDVLACAIYVSKDEDSTKTSTKILQILK